MENFSEMFTNKWKPKSILTSRKLQKTTVYFIDIIWYFIDDWFPFMYLFLGYRKIITSKQE